MDQQTMRQFESMCIQEEAPVCQATCPLHVDVRAMLKHVRAGDFAEAYKIYKKSVPFPELLSAICNEPCRHACRLSEICEGIHVRQIEQFLTEQFADQALPKVLPNKPKNAAIFGNGLDALAAAYDLRRKGYQVTRFRIEPAYEANEQSAHRNTAVGTQTAPFDAPATNQAIPANGQTPQPDDEAAHSKAKSQQSVFSISPTDTLTIRSNSQTAPFEPHNASTTNPTAAEIKQNTPTSSQVTSPTNETIRANNQTPQTHDETVPSKANVRQSDFPSAPTDALSIQSNSQTALFELRNTPPTDQTIPANEQNSQTAHNPAPPRELLERIEHLLLKLSVSTRNIINYPSISQILSEINNEIQYNADSFQVAYFGTDTVIYAQKIDSRAISSQGIFGGTARTGQWVEQLSDGRRAAISMDRFLQNVSLTASREDEGAHPCRLYTSLADVAPSQSTLSTTTPPTAEQIQAEAQRCIQCDCMECAKGCEFIRHYQDSPRTYIRQMYNNISICTGLRQKNQMINSCALCGQCEAVCPNRLPFQDFVRDTRRQMVATHKMPPSAFDFALRDMDFSNNDRFAFAANPAGSDKSDFLFFPGCQLPASSPETVEKLYAFLRERLPASVGLMLRCCGALADWAGNTSKFDAAAAELAAEWERLGQPVLILACPTCQKMFADHFSQIQTVSIWEILQKTDFPFPTFPVTAQITLAIHDPCAARSQPATRETVRAIAAQIGLTTTELPFNNKAATCCSYGGNAWNANPALSAATVQARVDDSPLDYLTYCAMCRDFFLKGGKRTYHLLDLLFDPAQISNPQAPSRPDYSMRHENRTRVKKHLTQKYWRGTVENDLEYTRIQLQMSDEVRRRMEDRMILTEDLQQVLAEIEKSGRFMIHQETGHYLAHATPACVTYWVEYLPTSDGYEIFNAYSHRMFIEEQS